MSSKNVETLRVAHESWNRRDFEGTIGNMVDNLTYRDHSQNRNISGKEDFREWIESWAESMSDGKITSPQYLDAGDTVIAQFIAEGTNDGEFCGLASTGRHVSFAMCEIWKFDKSGRMVSGGCYYDLYTILTQLGHVEPLATAA